MADQARYWHGQRRGRKFAITVKVSEDASGECKTCGWPTRRSIYGILHRDCSICRQLKSIYGPSIAVVRRDAR